MAISATQYIWMDGALKPRREATVHAEITPVRGVDGKATRANGCGPLTALLLQRFFGRFTDETGDRWHWLHPIPVEERATRHAAR